jgi:hypothetical protein
MFHVETDQELSLTSMPATSIHTIAGDGSKDAPLELSDDDNDSEFLIVITPRDGTRDLPVQINDKGDDGDTHVSNDFDLGDDEKLEMAVVTYVRHEQPQPLVASQRVRYHSQLTPDTFKYRLSIDQMLSLGRHKNRLRASILVGVVRRSATPNTPERSC